MCWREDDGVRYETVFVTFDGSDHGCLCFSWLVVVDYALIHLVTVGN